eukprot:CAMPEP_0170612346 /NCGR_PEP_ID=MMETSP0224-20130122/23674_1 /TAXON_ID=285029 /ORGANISM="Togula jolla, Strain CCCM 725" /LENGTH=115 /DNA_ID=CAMNT_0010937843 /DNA_START=440 /DNA_END=785 /DNA_ORIENTATION=-
MDVQDAGRAAVGSLGQPKHIIASLPELRVTAMGAAVPLSALSMNDLPCHTRRENLVEAAAGIIHELLVAEGRGVSEKRIVGEVCICEIRVCALKACATSWSSAASAFATSAPRRS